MLTWLTNNIGTIFVSLILVGIVCAVTIKLIRDKKKGKTSCGCEHCSMSDICTKQIDCQKK